MTKTKIICTLGPASGGDTILRKMIFAGMDVARLNFSHGKEDIILRWIDLIRGINKRYRRHIRFLGDLEGHRIRIGRFAGDAPIELKRHQTVTLTQEDILGVKGLIPFDYKGPIKDIKIGQHVYIDDGNIDLEVTGHGKRHLITKVIVGAGLKERKGVNIPGAKLQFRGLSHKDIEDINFCKKHGVDFIAQSFVRTKKDILDVRPHSGKCRLIAKIESREGIENIDDIVDVSDGIMVARGDMGISVPIYEIPIIQKMIIKKCNRAGKFVITATQMLESMTDNRIPTRAEVTDVANAIIDGTDYVMLSAESAVGNYPVETVKIMNEIIKYTEDYLNGKIKI